MTSKYLQKEPKKSQPFLCEKCNFVCSKQSSIERHYLTLKHQNTYKYLHPALLGAENVFSCLCGAEYKHRQSLYHHKKKCNVADTENTVMVQDTSSNDIQTLTCLVMDVVRQNQELTKQIIELSKTSTSIMTNCHNNTNTINNNKFNLNVFLNEKCKDALNISEFVNSLQLQIQDLENTGEYGFAEGISRVFMRGLKELDIYKRPIHCSDLKREIIHVKSDNKWEKEGSDRATLKKAIKQIANKNICMIPEWKKANPGCDKYDSRKNDKYLKLMVQSMGPTDEKDEEKEFNKIIRFVAKETVIDKDCNMIL